jgi:hypothetical protein
MQNFFFLYGCEIYSLTLMEQGSGRIVGPKRGDITGHWRSFTKYWVDQVKEGQMDRTCSMHWEMRGAYTALFGKSEQKRPLRTRHWLVVNIKMVSKKMT